MPKIDRPPAKKALQLKITLLHARPPIWRRILVADNLTFWDLHCAIQDAMGWTNSHLHEFQVGDPRSRDALRIGLPDEDMGDGVRAGWEVHVRPQLSSARPELRYVYDFGDGWEHSVRLEKTLPLDDGDYPRCVAGRRRCPPEDCGGIPGYARLLDVLANPQDPEHAEMVDWAGGPIDPAEFDAGEVRFLDPDRALRFALEMGG